MGSEVRRVEGPQSEGCWLLGVGSGEGASESAAWELGFQGGTDGALLQAGRSAGE